MDITKTGEQALDLTSSRWRDVKMQPLRFIKDGMPESSAELILSHILDLDDGIVETRNIDTFGDRFEDDIFDDTYVRELYATFHGNHDKFDRGDCVGFNDQVMRAVRGTISVEGLVKEHYEITENNSLLRGRTIGSRC